MHTYTHLQTLTHQHTHTVCWGAPGEERGRGDDWTFAGRYSTLAPSASKWSNPTTLWRPEFRNRATVQHFGAPDLGIEQQYNTLAPRVSESNNPTTLWRPVSRNRATLYHFGALIPESSTLIARWMVGVLRYCLCF